MPSTPQPGRPDDGASRSAARAATALRPRRGIDRLWSGPRDGDVKVAPWQWIFRKSAVGERRTAAVLERELEGMDTIVLHSIDCGALGEITHIAVGPGGITVIDTKGWSGRITSRRQVLRSNGLRRDGDVRTAGRQRMAIRLALAGAPPQLRNVNVIAVICLPDEERRPVDLLTEQVLLSGPMGAAIVARRGGTLEPIDIGDIAQTLRRELPRITEGQLTGRELETARAPRAGLRWFRR